MEKKANAIDLIKLIAAILIVGSHCLPIFKSDSLNFYYGQWFFRSCVPLFFVSTGYFFSRMNDIRKISYIKRIIVLYMCSMLLYLPLYINIGLASFVVRILFGYYHLWYLSAMAIGLIFIFLAEKYKCCNYWLIFLIFAGAVFCEYYKLFDSKALSFVARLILVVGGARHALFFAIPLMLIGHYIAHHTPPPHTWRYVVYANIFHFGSF